MGIIGSKIWIIIALITLAVSIPLANNNIAANTARSVRETKLPDNTEYVEIFSKAGKLNGCGNGMQYLGGILIKSELSLDDLQLYYSDYAQHEWEYIVEKQTDKNIGIIEHGTLLLNADINDNNYYIVYSWGDNNSFFRNFDIRGH